LVCLLAPVFPTFPFFFSSLPFLPFFSLLNNDSLPIFSIEQNFLLFYPLFNKNFFPPFSFFLTKISFCFNLFPFVFLFPSCLPLSNFFVHPSHRLRRSRFGHASSPTLTFRRRRKTWNNFRGFLLSLPLFLSFLLSFLQRKRCGKNYKVSFIKRMLVCLLVGSVCARFLSFLLLVFIMSFR
jgi:hypothetical protein